MSGGTTSGTPAIPGLPTAIPPSSSASATSPLGLTDGWGTALINLSGFPLGVMQALTQAGLDTSQPQPGNVIAQALAKLPRAQVQQVQQMLYYGGFYTGVTNITQLQLGRFQASDITALKSLVQTAGQTGQPIGSYLVGAANYGQAQGTLNQVAGVGVKPIPLPADVDVDTALRASAQSLLGHPPSADDLAAFRGIYDQMLVSASKQAQALAAQNTALSGDPEALGAAAGRLGEPGYFGDPTQAPPAPGSGSMQSPWQTLTSGARGVMGPAANGYQVPGTQADAQEFGQEQASSAYQQQQTADQNTVSQFNTAANTAIAGSEPTLQSAPNINNAADQFLQDRYGSQIANQSALTKYAQVLSFMRGTGQ